MRMKKVSFLENYIIEVNLSPNYKFYYDLRPMIHSPRFKKLTKKNAFQKGTLEDGCRIVWENNICLEDYEIFGYEFIESNLYYRQNENLELSNA